MSEPFRVGIRAFNLRDSNVGGFAMFNRIRYEAQVCGAYDMPTLFGGAPLTKWIRQRKPIFTASDLNCVGLDGSSAEECLWASFTNTPASDRRQWAIGHHTKGWDTLIHTNTHAHPIGEFLYQVGHKEGWCS